MSDNIILFISFLFVSTNINAEILKDIKNSPGQHYNGEKNNIRIYNQKIVPHEHSRSPDGYGVLFLDDLSGENADIVNNIIESREADAIEINTVSGAFRGTKIIGNTLYGGKMHPDKAAGFSIGIANGKDIVAIGNISKVSKNEALHIEGPQENIIVSNNIFRECLADCARILNYDQARSVQILGNVFEKAPAKLKTGKGLYIVWDYNGFLDQNIISHNRIIGFKTGLYANTASGDSSRFIFDNNLIEDCDTAIFNRSSHIVGKNFTKNCNVLLTAGARSRTGKIFSSTTPSIIMNKIDEDGIGAILEGFNFPLSSTELLTGYTNIRLFALPTTFTGNLELKYQFNKDFFMVSYDIHWDKGNLTFKTRINSKGGGLDPIKLINIDNSLYLRLFSNTDRTINQLLLNFDGVYYKK